MRALVIGVAVAGVASFLVWSYMKRFEDEGLKIEDLPLLEWNYRNALYDIQMRLDEVLTNLPLRPAAWLLRLIAFPLGRHRRPPSDRLTHACAKLILSATETRERLTDGIYVSRSPADPTGRMEVAFTAAIERDGIEEKIRASGHSVKRALSESRQRDHSRRHRRGRFLARRAHGPRQLVHPFGCRGGVSLTRRVLA